MLDVNGLAFRLKLLEMREPWRGVLQCIHDVAYENFRDMDLRVVLHCLRDMRHAPPRGGDTIFDCLHEWRATAVSKHFAIHNLLMLLGLKPSLWMAPYEVVDNLPIDCHQLLKAANKHRVKDVHVFVTCDFGAGERIVDLTYPARLRDRQFIVTDCWHPDQDCCSPKLAGEAQAIEPNARGLLRVGMLCKQINPGLSAHYSGLIREHILAKTCEEDDDETRTRHIQRHYLRQLAKHTR